MALRKEVRKASMEAFVVYRSWRALAERLSGHSRVGK